MTALPPQSVPAPPLDPALEAIAEAIEAYRDAVRWALRCEHTWAATGWRHLEDEARNRVTTAITRYAGKRVEAERAKLRAYRRAGSRPQFDDVLESMCNAVEDYRRAVVTATLLEAARRMAFQHEVEVLVDDASWTPERHSQAQDRESEAQAHLITAMRRYFATECEAEWSRQ